MKKSAAIVVLIAVILGTFGFALAKTLSFRNPGVRAYFSGYPRLREILGLHYDGDAAADYLGGKYAEILIEVDSMDGREPDRGALELLAQKISAASGKRAAYVLSDQHIPYEERVDSGQIARLAGTYRNYYSTGRRAAVYLFSASRDGGEEQLLGKTYQEDGILLFEDALRDFVGANPAALPVYEESTALHEFGHQIGLNHAEGENCLMAGSAKISRAARERPADAVTDFCPAEQAQIQILKSEFNN